VHNVASLGTLFTDDCALSPRINKSLYRVIIDLSVNVEHGNLTKKLWTIFKRSLVVRLYHTFTDLILDLFLCFNVVWVSIVKL
jgi:hypothetical protein